MPGGGWSAADIRYFWYQGNHFVSTIDARIAAEMVNIVPIQSGRLISWQGEEGENVSQNQKLGTVDAGSAVSSINAPISGKIVQVSVTEGQAVSVSQAVAVVADMDNNLHQRQYRRDRD
jgi:multidrug resistance efflux pump